MNNNFITDSELKKQQAELTNLALKLADVAQVNLDYSIDSIQNVDKILDQIHAQYLSEKNEEGVRGMALELAAYIITVIEKHIKIGKWSRNSVEMGKETFPYEITKGEFIFPYAWCLKYIIEGQKEGVWSKFESLVISKHKNSKN